LWAIVYLFTEFAFFAIISVVLLLSFTQVQDVTIKSWAFAVSVVAEVSIASRCYYRYL